MPASQVQAVITGSAGLGVAKASGLDFVQEVYATAAAVNALDPGTDAVIELGGEDAKIIFFGNSLEERMNGSWCRRYRRVHRPDGHAFKCDGG